MSRSGSKVTRSGAHFTLFDLDMTMSSGQMVVKNEKVSSSFPIKRTFINLTLKTLGCKKRKTARTVGLSLENLEVEDALQKLVSFSLDVSANIILLFVLYFFPFLMSFLFQVSDHISANLRIQAKRVEL